MAIIPYTFWLAQQAIGFLFVFWPTTIALVVAVIAAAAIGLRNKLPRLSGRQVLILLSPLVITFLILFWGSLMSWTDDSASGPPPRWPVMVAQGLFGIQLIVGILILVKFSKAYRLFAGFSVVLELWFAFLCMGVAEMSATGNWI